MFNRQGIQTYRGKDARSLSRYSPRAFWIFPSRSASLSRLFWTPGMLRMSITSGDLATFRMRARNSALILKVKEEKGVGPKGESQRRSRDGGLK